MLEKYTDEQFKEGHLTCA